ncbi:ComEC/Rec2 family competence protein [bacterium]|nr:ComEC/Rec2 family competence protein [bacterium]
MLIIKWWFQYCIPIFILALVYLLFSQIGRVEQNLQACAYKPGKIDVVTAVNLKKAVSVSHDLICYSAQIEDSCSLHHSVMANVYFSTQHAPTINEKNLIVKGKMYVGQNNKIKIYTKQWFNSARSQLMPIQKLYAYISSQLRFLPDTDFALLQATIFAQKQYLSRDLKKLFKRLGIGHLLVVSGIHFALIVLVLKNCVLKLIFLNLYTVKILRVDSVDLVLSTIIGLLYLCMIDFPVSAQRAYVFIVLGKLMHSLGVRCSIFSLLFCSALALYIFDHKQVWTLSFVYSFLCVLAIAIFQQKNKVFFSAVQTSLGIFSMSQLLTCMIFSSLNPMSWFLNLLFIPLFSVVLAVYCLFTIGMVFIHSPFIIKIFINLLHAFNAFLLKGLHWVDAMGMHEVKLESNVFFYSFLLSMTVYVGLHIVRKSQIFYKQIH